MTLVTCDSLVLPHPLHRGCQNPVVVIDAEQPASSYTAKLSAPDVVPNEIAPTPESNRPTDTQPTKGSPRFHEILREMGELHDRKQRDYGKPGDPFANVRGGEDWNIPAWVAAMVRASDKVRRLQQYARTGTLANEGVRDSFLDLAVYAIIALALWEEQN